MLVETDAANLRMKFTSKIYISLLLRVRICSNVSIKHQNIYQCWND